MSAQTTRMLVLGVVHIFGPANGYQLRRELLSWEVERWAHLNPGSIYSMLGTLERDGAVTRHDLAMEAGARPVAVYTVTDAGRAELDRILLEAIETVPDSGDPLPLRVAVNFAPMLTRERYVAALERRIGALGLAVDTLVAKHAAVTRSRQAPPHVGAELELELGLVRAQLAWLEEHLVLVRGGGLVFAGELPDERWGWTPPPDDPGWRMQREREQYARKLGVELDRGA